MVKEISEGQAGTVNTVILSGDSPTYGVPVESGTQFTLDLNTYDLQIHRDENGEYAGSPGTKTLGFQLLKDSDIVIKGGEIAADDTKMLVQNYSNLTLEDVILRGTVTDTYVLSNNFGEVHLKGDTQILATGSTRGKENVAFDLWYGMAKDGSYDDGVSVYIDDPTVVIQGPIEFGHASRITDEAQFLERTHLYVCEGYNLESLRIPAGYEFVASSIPGYVELRPVAVAQTPEVVNEPGE